MASFILVSAVAGDQIHGVEISDPECPVEWSELPEDARQWASEQGYGHGDAELLYVLPDGAEIPAGFPARTVG